MGKAIGMIDTSKFRAVIVASLLLVLATYGMSQQTSTQQNSGNETADLASMDLEQLMNLKVTTASLFSDTLSQAPSIMSVVTSDELRRFGGLTLG